MAFDSYEKIGADSAHLASAIRKTVFLVWQAGCLC